jgi:RNA-directed DNA polymerase
MGKNNPQTLVSLGLARAFLAGARDARSMAARGACALGENPAWLPVLVNALLPMSLATWERLTVDDLAARIGDTPAFSDAWTGQARPVIRRWILRPSTMTSPPLGLDTIVLPQLDHSAALAQWLGITPDTLDWFTWPAARQRKVELHRQHHAFSLLPKARGGGRLIEAPRRRLKTLQRQVLQGILNAVPVHEACHGFVAGRSVLSHARVHAGQAVVLHFDLEDFFSSITSARVQAVFRTLGYPPGVALQLARLCTLSTPEPVLERMREDGWLTWPQARRLRSPHLAQGAPSSPMLANLCAFSLDLRLEGLAHGLGARYSRYADDLVISGPASLQGTLQRIGAWVGRIALEEGYRLNHRKTRITTQGAAQRVCGIVVNQHPNMQRREFDRLRALLHQCVLHGPASQNREGHADFRAHLLGRVTWLQQINPAKARRVMPLWNAIAWHRPEPDRQG